MYDFLLPFYSIYIPILCGFLDIARH